MKGRISGTGCPAELDPAGIGRALKRMNEAAAEGRGYSGDELPLIGADGMEVDICTSAERGGWNVGQRIEKADD